MITIFNNREVEYEIEYASTAEDSFIGSAYYTDLEQEELSDGDIELLQRQEDGVIQEEWYEYQIGRADYYGED